MNLPPVHAVHRNLSSCPALKHNVGQHCCGFVGRRAKSIWEKQRRRKERRKKTFTMTCFFFIRKNILKNSSFPVFAETLHLHFYCLIARQQTRKAHKQRRKFTPFPIWLFAFSSTKKKLERKCSWLSAEDVTSQLHVRFQRHLL